MKYLRYAAGFLFVVALVAFVGALAMEVWASELDFAEKVLLSSLLAMMVSVFGMMAADV